MAAGEIVRQKREALGWSQEDLAERVGVSQTTIQKIEDGRTRRSRYFPEIARVLDIPLSELDAAFATAEQIIPAEALVGRKDLPIYGTAEGGAGSVIVSYDPIDYVKRPFMLESVRGGYGILITGESMVPVVRPGDYLLVHPHIPPRSDDVAVFYHVFLGDAKATVKEYRAQTDKEWRVRRYSPKQQDFALPKADWQHCHVSVGRYSRR